MDPITELIDVDTRKAGKDKLEYFPRNFIMRKYYQLYNRLIGTKYYYNEYNSLHPNYETNGIWSVARVYY